MVEIAKLHESLGFNFSRDFPRDLDFFKTDFDQLINRYRQQHGNGVVRLIKLPEFQSDVRFLLDKHGANVWPDTEVHRPWLLPDRKLFFSSNRCCITVDLERLLAEKTVQTRRRLQRAEPRIQFNVDAQNQRDTTSATNLTRQLTTSDSETISVSRGLPRVEPMEKRRRDDDERDQEYSSRANKKLGKQKALNLTHPRGLADANGPRERQEQSLQPKQGADASQARQNYRLPTAVSDDSSSDCQSEVAPCPPVENYPEALSGEMEGNNQFGSQPTPVYGTRSKTAPQATTATSAPIRNMTQTAISGAGARDNEATSGLSTTTFNAPTAPMTGADEHEVSQSANKEDAASLTRADASVAKATSSAIPHSGAPLDQEIGNNGSAETDHARFGSISILQTPGAMERVIIRLNISCTAAVLPLNTALDLDQCQDFASFTKHLRYFTEKWGHEIHGEAVYAMVGNLPDENWFSFPGIGTELLIDLSYGKTAYKLLLRQIESTLRMIPFPKDLHVQIIDHKCFRRRNEGRAC